MLHIQVHLLSHVSLACIYACCSRFKQSTDYSCAPVGKETPVSLCSCTPCEGIHAQVTSQRGGGGGAVSGEGGGVGKTTVGKELKRGDQEGKAEKTGKMKGGRVGGWEMKAKNGWFRGGLGGGYLS